MENIDDLQSNLPLPENLDAILVKSKVDLEAKIEEQTRGIMFRSRANWVEYGERSSKYFFSFEKSRYNAKTSSVLIDKSIEYREDADILRLEKTYYQQLYARDDRCSFNLTNESDVKVPEMEHNLQGCPITKKELGIAIKSMKIIRLQVVMESRLNLQNFL